MKILLILLLTLFALPISVQAQDFDKTDKIFLAATQTMLIGDMLTTLDIAHDCRNGGSIYETNPILGRCPSRTAVYGYFIGVSAATWLIARALPPTERKFFLGVVGVVEVGYVSHNLSMGLRFRF